MLMGGGFDSSLSSMLVGGVFGLASLSIPAWRVCETG